jgi:Killing trait
MKSETTVQPLITDSVVTSSVQNVASAPAVSMGSLYTNLSNSVALSAINAVHAQQQANIVHQAATAKAVALLLGEE